MELNRHTHRQLRLQGLSFTLLFLIAIGLLAWLSIRYDYQADWTASGRHTLSPATVSLLAALDDPVEITAFTRNNEGAPIPTRIKALVSRYQQHKHDIQLNFINPDLAPDKVREHGITLDGELILSYQGRSENLQTLGEESLTNALQRLARSNERTLIFIEGHGERSPLREANHDLSAWATHAQNKGFRLATLNLPTEPAIPAETSVLILASPQVDLLPGEVDIIRKHVEQGGNLLWLAEPNESRNLDALAQLLNIRFPTGIVVDPTTQLLGIEHPAFAVIAEYPEHPVTSQLTSLSLFPFASAIETGINEDSPWQIEPILQTVPRSWLETSKLSGTINYNEGKDLGGPLNIGIAMTRSLSAEAEPDTNKTQRVIVLGDGDFLSNTYLGNGANLELANRLINWLSHDDSFVTIPAKTATDTQLEMNKALMAIIGFGFLFLIPGLLLVTGITIWHKRRKH